MALNNVTIVEGQGGLGRVAPGEDYISGMPFYSDVLPSGFTTTNNKKVVNSLAQAESLGIVNTYIDETKATATFTITGAGATGNTLTLFMPTPRGNVSMGVYTRKSTHTTVTLVAAGIVTQINSGTLTHGFSATSTAGVITITSAAGYGVWMNTQTISLGGSGTITYTGTAFTGGVASLLAGWHYHIKEYFRMNPKGKLYVGFYPLSSNSTGYTFAELTDLQNFANGKIRQMGVYLPVKYPSSETALTMISTAAGLLDAVAEVNKGLHQPFVVVFCTNLVGITDLTTLPDLRTLNYSNVSCIVAEDGYGKGYDVARALGYSITAVGTLLGAISKAKVSESIAYVSKFNLVDISNEMSILAFANGIGYYTLDTATALNDLRYIFCRTFPNVSGTYFNDDFSTTAITDTYAYISENRVSQKMARLLYAAYIPQLNGELQLNGDGTLADTTLEYFTTLGESALDIMIEDSEVSAIEILIDSAQNILATSNLQVTCNYIRKGIARNITITLQPKTTL
jgi:hypothetical protein